MGIRFIVVVLALFFLAACSSTKTPPLSEPPEQPLFTDADLDKATVQTFNTTSVEALSEVDAASGAEVDESSESFANGDIAAQAVLPGATGIIAYIRYTPTATNPYAIILFDQATDIRTVVYSGKREIDSVAVDSLGASSEGPDEYGARVVFSARQTINVTSDFEIYQLFLDGSPITVLTNNTSDDTNVSVSANAGIIAWEGLRTTTGTRQVQWLETATSTLKTLNSSVNDTMPSVSGDGGYLAFIRTLSTGLVRVQVYQISTTTLTTVSNTTTPKKHPSVSDGNRKVVWTEMTATPRVIARNMATGTNTVVLANANGIEHAHVRQDGKYLTYGLLQNGKWQLYTRNLTTNTSVKGVGSTTFDTKGMFWASSFLDTTFGTGGVVITNFAGVGDDYGNDFGDALTLDSSGRIVVTGSDYTNDSVNLGLMRHNANGSLDTNFSTDGKVSTNIPGNDAYAYDVVIDNGGKILTVGEVSGAASFDYIITRHNSDGSPDTDFGTNGIVTTDFNDEGDTASVVAIDSNDNIVVAGTALVTVNDPAGDFDFGLARYTPDGNLDCSFGVLDSVAPGKCGLVITDFGETYETAKDMVLTDTKIFVVGDHRVDVGGPNDSTDLIIARYDSADGGLDSSFGGGGKVITDFAGVQEFAYAATVDSSGKLLVVGSIEDNPEPTLASNDVLLVRYNTDGSLDTTFGTGGKVVSDIGGVSEEARAVSIDSNGKIVVVGNTNVGICGRIFVARYNSDGMLDTSFGINGKYITHLAGCNEVAYDLKIDDNGKMVVTGFATFPGPNKFLVARFNP
jgi:uncharacterized delta-60 repeat protein